MQTLKAERTGRWKWALVIGGVAFAVGYVSGHHRLADRAAVLLRTVFHGLDAFSGDYRSQRLAFLRASTGCADIIMVGDSLTESGDWAELLPSYRVLNRGMGLDTSADVLARIDEVIWHKPKIVFVMAGLNDVGLDVPHEQIMANMRQIAVRLRDSGAIVVLQSTLPVAGGLNEAATNARLSSLDLSIRDLATEIGVRHLDVKALFLRGGSLDPSVTWDGIHIGALGYRRWRDRILEELGTLGVGTSRPTDGAGAVCREHAP